LAKTSNGNVAGVAIGTEVLVVVGSDTSLGRIISSTVAKSLRGTGDTKTSRGVVASGASGTSISVPSRSNTSSTKVRH
jgi:hypothetical protein